MRKNTPSANSNKIFPFCKPWVVFLSVALAIIIAGTSFLYFNFYFLFSGNDPAGPEISAEPFKQIWTERPVLLLGIGDSVTKGFGVPKQYSYFDRLISNPEQDSKDMIDKNLSIVLPNLKTKNIAASGSNSSHHYKKIQALETQPENVLGLVTITTGGNDLIHNYGRSQPEECAMYGTTVQQAQPWIENFKTRLDKMIYLINQKFPGGCHIFLANIYDPSDGTGNSIQWITNLSDWPDGLKLLQAYNQIITGCVNKFENVYLVDIHSAFLGHGLHCKKFWLKHYSSCDPSYWYHINIEDPSKRGYDAIRRLFLIEIIKVLYNKEIHN